MYKLKLTFLSLVFFTACQSSPEGMKMAFNDESHITPPRTSQPPAYAADDDIPEMKEDIVSKRPIKKDINNRKIIKNAQLKMEVESLEESTLNIKAILASLDGYLSNGQMYQSHRELNQYLEFRIPKDNFEAALTEVRKQSLKVLNEKINSRDVSEEFVDIQSRLQTKKEVRDRYIAVLRNKASTIEEILLAEETIRKLQEEIEAKEGRLKYLIDQTSYSTIKINLVEFIKAEVVVVEPYSYPFFDEAKESLKNGWENILMFIVSLLNVWPFILIACFIFWKRANILAPFKRNRSVVES
jgi:HEPN domain-containing protein